MDQQGDDRSRGPDQKRNRHAKVGRGQLLRRIYHRPRRNFTNRGRQLYRRRDPLDPDSGLRLR
ncbi:MAG: hypothetical protein EB079_06010, partial [Verrucomicrobia bacterium]|nr:hypothetical protein [Verrucomicrobiota bacterium]